MNECMPLMLSIVVLLFVVFFRKILLVFKEIFLRLIDCLKGR